MTHSCENIKMNIKEGKILKKYQEKFQIELFREVDDLFPENKSKERDKALLLITVLGIKFQNSIEELLDELKQEQDGNNTTTTISE